MEISLDSGSISTTLDLVADKKPVDLIQYVFTQAQNSEGNLILTKEDIKNFLNTDKNWLQKNPTERALWIQNKESQCIQFMTLLGKEQEIQDQFKINNKNVLENQNKLSITTTNGTQLINDAEGIKKKYNPSIKSKNQEIQKTQELIHANNTFMMNPAALFPSLAKTAFCGAVIAAAYAAQSLRYISGEQCLSAAHSSFISGATIGCLDSIVEVAPQVILSGIGALLCKTFADSAYAQQQLEQQKTNQTAELKQLQDNQAAEEEENQKSQKANLAKQTEINTALGALQVESKSLQQEQIRVQNSIKGKIYTMLGQASEKQLDAYRRNEISRIKYPDDENIEMVSIDLFQAFMETNLASLAVKPTSVENALIENGPDSI